jgi:hypothetical protein
MAEAERGGITQVHTVVRPLEVRHDLGAITRVMLPAESGEASPDLLAYLREIAEQTRILVRDTLIEASARGRPGDILAAIKVLGVELAAAYEEQFAIQRRADAGFERNLSMVQCRKGCSFCCHVKVSTTPLEVARIAAATEAGRFPDRRAAILANADALTGLDARDHLSRKLDCPFLIEGACSIHEIRPLTCRALLSRSALVCQQRFESSDRTTGSLRIPSLVTPRLLAAGFLNGEIAAMRDLGLAGHLVELTASLALLAREPAAFVRWLGGGDVFARA